MRLYFLVREDRYQNRISLNIILIQTKDFVKSWWRDLKINIVVLDYQNYDI